LLILEAIHQADEGTLRFLARIQKRLENTPVGILALCRTNDDGALPTDVGRHLSKTIRQLPMVRLQRTRLDALLDLLLGRHLLSRDLRKTIWASCGGTPEGVVEILRHLGRQDLIYVTKGVWRERRRIPGAPDQQVFGAIADRLEALPDPSVRFLRLLAACGGTTSGAVIAEALGINRLDYLKVSGSLERVHRVILSDIEGATFRYEALRKILLDRIPLLEAQEIHAAIANALARVHAHNEDPVLEAIATHARLGGLVELASRKATEAGERADSFFDYGRAAYWFEAALSQLDGTSPGLIRNRCDLLTKLGRAFLRQGKWGQAESAYERLREMAVRENAFASFEHASAFRGLGLVRVRTKRYDEAEDLYNTSLAEFRVLSAAGDVCDVLIKLGRLFLERGRWTDFDRAYGEAFALAQESGNRTQLADLLMNTAIRHNMCGEPERALGAYERCLNIYRSLRLWDRVTACLLNIGKCLADAERYSEARKRYGECLRLARRRSDLLHEAVVKLNLSEILLKEGDVGACLKMAAGARDSFESMEHQIGIADALRIQGCARSEAGSWGLAERAFRESLRLNREVGYALGEAEAGRDFGLARINNGQKDLAANQLMEAEERFRELGVEAEVERIRTALAQLDASGRNAYRQAV